MSVTGQPSLYERLGGAPAVKAAVEIFYEKIMADTRVSFFFEDVDMTRQRAHQRAFMTYAFGGAPYFDGRSLRRAHARLVAEKGLSDAHFDAVAENLKATLDQLGVPETLAAEVMTIVGGTRDEVLNR